MQNEAQNAGSEIDRLVTLHRRYRELKRRGWHGIVWADCGAYYFSDELIPSWENKTRLSVDRLDEVLTGAELELRKPPYAERSVTSTYTPAKAV